MLRNKNVYSQEIWDQGYSNEELKIADSRDQVRRWLEYWTRNETPGRCLEIGCFPGRYLAAFGRRGYELSGVDLTPRITPEMRDWFIREGFKVGTILKQDFFDFRDTNGFDVVYSCGFIEHFSNWEEVLKRHLDFVKPGGLLLVNAPNFVGRIQKFFHVWLDRENYKRHYIPSMKPLQWKALVEEHGFEVIFSGYFFEFDFWVGVQKRSLFQKLAFWSLRALKPLLRQVLSSGSPNWSPYCGVVARRKA